MLKKERQNTILELIRDRKYCTVTFLSRQLFVAPITVRRDLLELEEGGLITRCHGGATIPDYENREVPFEVRNKQNHATKEYLAKIASTYIKPGDTVFLDASSTVSHITKFLTREMNLTVITNSPYVLEKLREKHILCYLTGGMPVENSYALLGSLARQAIRGFYANVCFFSAQGISEDGVISDQSEEETALRKEMIRNAQKQYFIFDDSKLGKHFTFKLCRQEEITGVITNSPDR